MINVKDICITIIDYITLKETRNMGFMSSHMINVINDLLQYKMCIFRGYLFFRKRKIKLYSKTHL